jgi:iron transport multicopper oxidase
MYQFKAAGQAGTYWYHSHYSTQYVIRLSRGLKMLKFFGRYCDGLRGPMVIYDPNDPQKSLYDVDDESTVITLADWYHSVSAEVQLPFYNDATLINGKGRAFDGTLRANTPLAIINVVQGKRYRLRIVNIACDPNYMFSIDGHTFQVIEADGESHRNLTVDSLQIFAGQRYSVVLNANRPIANYCMSLERGVRTCILMNE